MAIHLYLLKGVMLGFEMVETVDNEKYIVFDLLILRVMVEY